MKVEPSSQLLPPGTCFMSPGGRFTYEIIGPVCRIFDRAELPWPCCRLSWKGKEPAWARVGKRLIPDIAASRSPSYSVRGWDSQGNSWEQVLTMYDEKLTPDLKRWWVTKKPESHAFPEISQKALSLFT